MREDYSDKFKFDIIEDEPESASRIALWVWPVLGITAIGVIVITLLRSPWLLNKAGIPVPSANIVASSSLKTQPAAPLKPAKAAKMAKKDTASKPEPAPKAAKSTPPAKDPSQPEIADLHSELVKIADTLKAMKSTLQKQDARIGKLESVVGTVTGSIPAAKTPQTSSIQSKTEKTNTENQVNTAAKADLLAIATGKAKRLDPAAIPASSASAPQDTQDARTRHAPARIAALNTSTISRTAAPRPAIAATKVKAPVSISAKPRVQYAVKLARARSRGPLAAEWERLIRGKANELSVLEPQIMPAKTKSGESVLDLVAGPFNHMADAIELCARLKLKGIRCKQSRYGGKPL